MIGKSVFSLFLLAESTEYACLTCSTFEGSPLTISGELVGGLCQLSSENHTAEVVPYFQLAADSDGMIRKRKEEGLNELNRESYAKVNTYACL